MIKKAGLFILLLFCVITFSSCSKKIDVSIDNWYDYETRETLFTVKAKKLLWHCSSPYQFSITIKKPKENISELIQSSTYYVSEYQFKGETKTGKLFFSNDNYYVGYSSGEDYIIYNLILNVDCPIGLVYLSFPKIYNTSIINDNQSFKKIFENYNYQSLKEFYSRFNQHVYLNDEQEEIRYETKLAFKKGVAEVYLSFKEKNLRMIKDGEETLLYQC